MTHFVGIKELRLNMDKYAKKVSHGDAVIVMKHNKPFFQMTKPKDSWGDEGEWESVIDFTKIRKGGVPAEEVLTALRTIEAEDKKKK